MPRLSPDVFRPDSVLISGEEATCPEPTPHYASPTPPHQSKAVPTATNNVATNKHPLRKGELSRPGVVSAETMTSPTFRRGRFKGSNLQSNAEE